MGLFDIFKRDKGTSAEADEPQGYSDRKLNSLAKKASAKKAQDYERQEAMAALVEYGTYEAADALLKRFNLKVDPSITDQEERQMAFDGIVTIGHGEGRRVEDVGNKDAAPLSDEEKEELRQAVVERTRTYCERADNLTWPLKVLRELLDDEAYLDETLKLLAKCDTEYVRNVEPKINLLAALEDVVAERARLAAESYLEDVNETVRFHAVQTIYIQDDDASIPALVAMMEEEESVRVKNKVADGLARKKWKVPAELQEAFQAALEDAYEYRMKKDGGVGKAKK